MSFQPKVQKVLLQVSAQPLLDILSKGAIVIANHWAMSHDPEIFPDPFAFKPKRFLGDVPQRDPRKVIVGLGRRICSGMYLADASIFSCVISSLAVFSIEKALGEKGIPITPVHENTNGAMSHPKSFKYVIKPRSPKAFSLIAESLS